MLDEVKREQGQYYTKVNPFNCMAFRMWLLSSGLEVSHNFHSPYVADPRVLEPFAGDGTLIKHLSRYIETKVDGFDISPAHSDIRKQDTLQDFPVGYKWCVTNPPWLSKNSATRRGLPFYGEYDDLYKFALKKCLDNCRWVAALVPESFIRSDLFHDRLTSFVSITRPLFQDTSHPVGLALFGPEPVFNIKVFQDDALIGHLYQIKEWLPDRMSEKENDIANSIKFNDPSGEIGLIALDNTKEDSIRFCNPEEIAHHEIGDSSRAFTRISLGQFKVSPYTLNLILRDIRENTQDVLFTAYRGLRKDGKYRRRLDWDNAKKIIVMGIQQEGFRVRTKKEREQKTGE